MEENFKSKYHRKEPIRQFNVDQKLYDAVFSINEKDMDKNYSNFFSNRKTFYQLKNEADRLASALLKEEVKDEEKVAVLVLNTPEISAVLLGLNKIGAVSYWIDATSPANNIIEYLNKYNVKKMIVFEPMLPLIQGIINYTNLDRVVVIPINPLQKVDYGDNRFISYYDYINTNVYKDEKYSIYDRERPSVIIQSSGSTGASKSLVHSDFNFNNEILKMYYTDLPFYSSMKPLICVPPWVVYGLCNSVYSGLMFGQESIYAVNYTEDMIYNNLGKFDYSYGVPVLYRYLFDKIQELKKSNDPKSLMELEKIYNLLNNTKLFITGGDKISEDDLIKYQLEFNTPIINGYGNNEVVGAAVVSPLFANKPGSIGIPMHGNIVKAFDEDDNILENGKVGSLRVSSDSLFLGYLGNEEETLKIKSVVDNKTWVDTGDVGYIDNDGYVYVTGRSRYLIIDKKGFKISPEGSENFIKQLEYVKDCAVVGVEVDKNDCVPMAFIELKDEYKENEDVLEEIKQLCAKYLKEYERPKLFNEIDKIPYKENGGKRNILLLENLAKDIVSNNKLTLKI